MTCPQIAGFQLSTEEISDQKSTKSYSSNSVSELDDLTDLAANDISDVYGWEKEILDSPFWFSYCDGVFVFMRTVESEDAAHEQIDYLFKDYALAFLRTLGPILG